LKPYVDTGGYCQVNLHQCKKLTHKRIHQLVANAFIDNIDNKKCVDHINNDRLDNNVKNLRFATHQENNRNRKLTNKNKSGVKGVYFHNERNKWCAQIKIDGISIHLGLYENIEDAKKARINKVNEVFGVYKNACEN